MSDYSKIIEFIKSLYHDENPVPLHRPLFRGNEKKYLFDCIDSTFVSSVGEYVPKFEEMICDYTGVKYSVAVTNGTAALQIALLMCGVEPADEVITQPLTFVATCNAVTHCGAKPVFVDVDRETLGMSPKSLNSFLENETYQNEDNFCINKKSGKRVKACVPVHIFGHPCKIDKIVEICSKYNIYVVEDAAEAIGSKYKNRHCGTFGRIAVLSFNGNKTITSGGGGAILTNDKTLAQKAKHITTTAKVPHKYEYIHDEIGYNYRMPNINAALACAQLEQLDEFVDAKRKLADSYREFFSNQEIEFITEPENSFSNYWLNSIVLKNKKERDKFLAETNNRDVMTRPCWTLMTHLPMYKDSQRTDLSISKYYSDRLVNIPSSVVV